MRTDVNPDSKDALEQRAKEKEAQRDELFGSDALNSEVARDYVREQTVEKPKKIKVGKPEFRSKF